jgi:pyrimidine-nucleoside phosphorylase
VIARPRTPVELIIKKRDGHSHSREEIRWLIEELLAERVTDYQMSAWLMAVFLRGLDEAETAALTDAMLHSGKILKLSSVRLPKVDKHSTGGVGDKISICLAPLVAACGVAVPMISGRGLGHTGGTLDKLEAIEGYRVALDARRFERIVRDVGVSMIGQTAELVPADRRLYALRDVTGTVESIPLIVASILSKKLAEGIDGLVLDVKAGRGAFMKDRRQARVLARALVRVGRRAGKKVVALITEMSAPIGRTIGNALETREAIEVLQGAGPEDTRELTLALGIEMLRVAGVAKTAKEARTRLIRALDSGAGLERLERMVRAHGGDARAVRQPDRLPRARHRIPVLARASGYLSDCDALELGLLSVTLGAGRSRAEQKVDPTAGIELEVLRGQRVERGQPLAWLHVNQRPNPTTIEIAGRAFRLSARRPKPRRLVMERIGG